MGRVISVPAKVEAHVDSFKEHFKLHEDSTVLGEKNDEYSKFSPFPPLQNGIVVSGSGITSGVNSQLIGVGIGIGVGVAIGVGIEQRSGAGVSCEDKIQSESDQQSAKFLYLHLAYI